MSPRVAPRLVLWLSTALFFAWAGTAEASPGWYCEPLQGFYPTVKSCPVSWRLASQTQIAQRQPAPEAEAQPPAPKPPADPGGQATFPAPRSLARGDQLDEWCKGMTTAINFAVCGDGELRTLALERLRAFNEANARLSPDQRKVFAADQNGWALSYPQSCGLAVAEPPALPLAPSVKECLAQAGRKRLAYLRSYGLASATDSAPAAAVPANPAPHAALPATPDTTAPPASPRSSTPAVRIPPAQQNQAAVPAEPQGSAGAARPEEKPTASDKPTANAKPTANEKPASGLVPNTVKIGALLIASAVVGLWLVGGLRRLRSPRRHGGSSPTA